ncbi:hypothetical protein [Hyphomicrobium sp.]|uniref:hypothetical protein n=1 Tax=Hyphomicrobium sp. TaxID=82 RepID=UPI002E2F6F77|nr:hypothetical protein [Hyphomicrobium sp.]HEX2840908.1 hypothetical protein [Hyphomicrobium sp.]
MIRDEHIEAAVAQGILTGDQAVRLRDLARKDLAPASVNDGLPDPDDEKFRLIGGFNDVFVTIGVLLLVAAFFGLASVLDFRPGLAVLAMISAWGLSEFFSRRMRLALPSITLALMFAGATGFLATSFAALLPSGADWADDRGFRLWIPLFSLGVLAGGVAHHWRFRVPIDVAIAAGGLTYAVYNGIGVIAPDWILDNGSALAAVLGLLLFASAVRTDASDTRRLTRRSDVAFWLHLLAAPMIVHAVIPLVAGPVSALGTGQAFAVLVVFALLGIVALVIDRRALLVSGLTYAGIAIGYLLSQSVAEGMGLSLTLLGLAIVVLGLSAGWRYLRRTVLPLLPLGSLRHAVPPAS